MLRLLFPVLLLLLLSSSSVSAQVPEAAEPTRAVVRDGGSIAALPPGVPRLPEPSEQARNIVVTEGNLEAFRPLLLAPLAAWIEEGEVLLSVVRRLDYPWRYSEQWQNHSIENVDLYRLELNGNLAASAEAVDPERGGFPFGLARHIDNESDPAVKARKILWSADFAQAASKDILYAAEISWIGAQSVSRQSEGIYYQKYYPFFPKHNAGAAQAGEEPSAESEAEGGEPITTPADSEENTGESVFRKEVLQLTSPPVVFGYAQVSWRFGGEEPDALWMYSPVIAKNRTLLSSNRSDGLLGGLMTLDDLGVRSSKIQAVSARVVDEKVLLLPYPSLRLYNAEHSQPTSVMSAQPVGALGATQPEPQQASAALLSVTGQHQRLDGKLMFTRWNEETKQITRAASWLPVTAHFIPREVWILEILPGDPYYTTGREILVVDKESMLPAYKLVYDHYGNFQRLVIGGWGLAEAKERKLRFPFMGFLIVVDATGREATTFTPSAVRTFLGKQTSAAEKLQELFDIETHGKNPDPESLQASPKEAQAVPDTPSVPNLASPR